MADDSALITSARAGDQQAFAALHRTHYRRALHEARKILPNLLDAEDCVSAAFASTFMAMRKGGGPTEAFKPYLLTSVRNSALQLVRLRRYTSEQATDEVEPAPHVDLYEIGADPAVRNAFQSLPVRWREVLWKTEIEGRAPRELAEELAMSANSVAALAKRARDGFRKAYLTEAIGPDPHPWAVERLDAYRAGTLDPRARDLVELHVENCARCDDILAPVPISAASIGIVLLAAGASAPAYGALVGSAAGATLVGRIRQLRPSGKSGRRHGGGGGRRRRAPRRRGQRPLRRSPVECTVVDGRLDPRRRRAGGQRAVRPGVRRSADGDGRDRCRSS